MRDLATQLLHLERSLLHDGHSRGSLQALLHEDFEEIGPGGRVTTRAEVLHWLLEIKKPEERWDFHDFRVTVLSGDLAQARYLARRHGATSPGSRRTSLWRRTPDGAWRLLFHQATPLTDAH